MEPAKPPGEPECFNDIVIYKRRRRTSKWDKVVITLKGSSLFYSEDEATGKAGANAKKQGDSGKSIQLAEAKVADVENFPDYPHAFSVIPKEVKRTYYFATTDNDTKLLLLNKVCDLQMGKKCSGGTADQSSACLIQ